MGKKFGVWVIIIGRNLYRVNIGDNTWTFFDTDNPETYYETVIMSGTSDITGAQHSQLESDQISWEQTAQHRT